MPTIEERLAVAYYAHVGSATQFCTAPGCEWIPTFKRDADGGVTDDDDSHTQHPAHRLAMVAEIAEDIAIEAYRAGFDKAQSQHTAHRTRRNQPHPTIVYTNPYERKP